MESGGITRVARFRRFLTAMGLTVLASYFANARSMAHEVVELPELVSDGVIIGIMIFSVCLHGAALFSHRATPSRFPSFGLMGVAVGSGIASCGLGFLFQWFVLSLPTIEAPPSWYIGVGVPMFALGTIVGLIGYAIFIATSDEK